MIESGFIEVLLSKELRGLCTNCANFGKCSYRKNSTKIIIQCELYELAEERQASDQQEISKTKGCVLIVAMQKPAVFLISNSVYGIAKNIHDKN